MKDSELEGDTITSPRSPWELRHNSAINYAALQAVNPNVTATEANQRQANLEFAMREAKKVLGE